MIVLGRLILRLFIARPAIRLQNSCVSYFDFLFIMYGVIS